MFLYDECFSPYVGTLFLNKYYKKGSDYENIIL